MIATLLACALQQQTISFTHGCANSAVVLKALGKELGVNMEPSGSVTKDYFLVSFKDVPKDEALKKIATTLNATWEREGDITYLKRTHKQDLEDFDTGYANRAKLLAKALQEQDTSPIAEDEARSLAIQSRDFQSTDPQKAFEQFQPIAVRLPGHRALIRLMRLLDLDQIVRAMPDQFHYGTGPHDLPLPPGSEAVTEDLRKDWEMFTRVASAAGATANDNLKEYFTIVPSALTFKDGLKVSVSPYRGHMYMQLLLQQSRGWRYLAYFNVSLLKQPDVPAFVQRLQSQPDLAPAVAASIKAGSYGAGDKSLLNALLDASDDNDVVLSAPGDYLMQAAKEFGASVVALVPDDAYLALSNAQLPERARTSAAVAAMIMARSVTADYKDGWLTVRPTEPYEARRMRIERQAFRRFVSRGATQGSLPFNAFATFAATTTDDSAVRVADSLMGRAFPTWLGLPRIGLDVIRAYGRLSNQEKTASHTSNVDLLANNPNRFLMDLSAMDVNSFTWTGGPLPVHKAFTERDTAAQVVKGMHDVWIRCASEDLYVPYRPKMGAGDFLLIMDADTFALNLSMSEHGSRGENPPDYTQLAHVVGEKIQLGYAQPSFASMHQAEYADPLSALTYGSMNDLSDELRKALSDAIQKQRKQSSGGRGG